MTDLPIACDLSATERERLRDDLLTGLLGEATAVHALPDGVELRFPPGASRVARVARVVDAERACCRFLSFVIEVAAAEGPVTLRVTGPAGTREFLGALAGIA
jgi:hypothetical protein